MKSAFSFLKMGKRHDLALIALLLIILCVMVLPIPVIVMDALLALNLTLAVLVLMVAVYLKAPLEFSTFPSVILLFTAFRIALSVASTRLILLEAEAGDIIRTFGEFVVQGNVVVGLVVFLIITTVQFLVITKGAERIAEVSARFTLDAMPGKQMSIEADIRNGDVDKESGRAKRDDLSKESQFFGAMDGAMKFVKGDAIAGLIIIVINLIGGISIGVAQKDMSFNEAIQIYSLLTVGDGLVAQIPALFIALCAGAVVTRVTSDTSSDLGSDIIDQLINNRKSIWAAAGVVALTGFLPGFPSAFFFSLSAGLATIAFVSQRRANKLLETESTEGTGLENVLPHMARHDDRVVIRVSAEDYDHYDWDRFSNFNQDAHDAFLKRFGFALPGFGVRSDPTLVAGTARIDLDEVPVSFVTAAPNTIFCHGDQKIIKLAIGSETLDLIRLPYGAGCWVDHQHQVALDKAGVGHYTVEESLQRSASHIVLANLGEVLSVDEPRKYLEPKSDSESAAIKSVEANIDRSVLHDVINRLMVESTPMFPRYAVFAAIADWSQKETDPILLTEYVRQSLRRQVCHSLSQGQNKIATYLVDTRMDKALRDAIQVTDVGGYLALDSATSSSIIEAFTKINEKCAHVEVRPTIVAANDVRRFLRKFLSRNNLLFPVISQQELCAEFDYQPLGVVRLR